MLDFGKMDNKTEEKYIEIMRKKSGDEKLRIAMKLTELDIEVMKAEIKAQNPNISSEDFERLLFEKRYGYKRPF